MNNNLRNQPFRLNAPKKHTQQLSFVLCLATSSPLSFVIIARSLRIVLCCLFLWRRRDYRNSTTNKLGANKVFSFVWERTSTQHFWRGFSGSFGGSAANYGADY
jgi:hypothetical protein